MRRRHFFSGLSAALSLGYLCIPHKTGFAIDPFNRPKPGKLKLSLAAYSMRQLLMPRDGRPAQMTLFDFVDFCRDQGLPGAELTSYYFPEEVTHDYLLKLKRHCHMRGISISGGAIRNDYCSQDKAAVERDLDHTRKWIDYYSVLGAPAIRIFAGKKIASEPLGETIKRCASNCQVACEYAEQKGIMLALENHGGVTERAEGLLDIVRQVDSPAFGVNFDSGNFRSSSDPYAELEQIAPYAVNAQIKVEIAPNGEKQEADMERILEILRSAGYSGWVALEYEAKQDPLKAIPERLRELQGMI